MQATHSELHSLAAAPSRETDELGRLLALALPLAAANLGQMLLSAVNTAVVGHLGERELGAVGLGGSLFFTFLVLGMGVMLALDPLVSQALGDADAPRARSALWQGVWLALALAVPLGALIIGSGACLERVGIDAASAELTRAYLWARIPGLVPYLWFVALRSYLGAHGATRSVLAAVAIANLVNLPLSLLLVLGVPALGVPGLGVAGAGWAATLATFAELGVLAAAVGPTPSHEPARRKLDPEQSARALGLGLPIGLGLLAEFGVFAVVNLLVGVAEPRALGAHQVAMTIASVSFTIPVGIGAAAAVRVGRAVGRGDALATRAAGVTGLLAGGGFMLLAAAAFLVAPHELAGLLASDPRVGRSGRPVDRDWRVVSALRRGAGRRCWSPARRR